MYLLLQEPQHPMEPDSELLSKTLFSSATLKKEQNLDGIYYNKINMVAGQPTQIRRYHHLWQLSEKIAVEQTTRVSNKSKIHFQIE